jgi:homocysteine S-methyltransferase
MVVKSGGVGAADEGAAGAAVRRWVEAGGGRLVLDGGLATELEAHGADLNDPLWSAKCILSSPHLIRKASPHATTFALPCQYGDSPFFYY